MSTRCVKFTRKPTEIDKNKWKKVQVFGVRGAVKRRGKKNRRGHSSELGWVIFFHCFSAQIMATTQQYSLKWNNYISHLAYHFENLRTEEEFTDVTLCCEGKKIKAHKIILSACSTYFRDVFKENPHPHPVIIFKNVKYSDLTSIIQFMYNGEVSVIQDLLPSFLQTAELLQVRGLTDTNLTESAKNLVAEEPRPAETLFFAVPQETNKLLTALSTTPLKTTTVQPQEIHTIRLDTSKLIEAPERGTPQLVKRKKVTVTQAAPQPQPAVSTVQTYETLGLDQEGELMEAEEGVEFLQTGMKMEMPDFIDVATGDRTKATTVTTEPTNYIQQGKKKIHLNQKTW